MKLRINLGIKNLYFVILCVVLTIEINPTYKEIISVRYGAIMVCFGLFCVRCIQCRRFPINLFWGWSISELFFCILSCIWSINLETTIQACKNIFIVLLICSMTYTMVENMNDFRAFWKSICIAYVFDSLYVLLMVGVDNIGTSRLGGDYAGLEMWNANSIGAFAGFGCVMFLHGTITANNKIEKIIQAFLAVFLLFICLNTGSRKALLVVSVTVILYFYLKDRGNKRIRNILIMLILLIVLWNIIMENDSLYDLMGARMERMLESFFGHQTSEYSMNMRTLMATQGMEYFCGRPILGYGLDCYRYLSPFGIYAHNNYIELMVGTGLIGLIIYYSIYVYAFIKGQHFVFKEHDDMAIFLFSILAIVVANHMAIVSYYDTTYNIMFLLFISYIKLLTQQRLRKNKEKRISSHD